MRPLEKLLIELGSSLGAADAATGLRVTEARLDVPVESRLAGSGIVLTTLPRGLLATGFQMPHARLKLRLKEGEL